MHNLGHRLRKARENKRFSQVEVYRRTGINNKSLSRYESGGTEPDADALRLLSELYDVSVDWLLGKTKKESDFTLSEDFILNIIKEAEREYKVSLQDDPLVESAVRDMIHHLAKMKIQNMKNN